MSADFVFANIVLFGPGFIFVKLLYLFGEQHRRLEWEWLVWSLIAGIPIAWGAEVLITRTLPADMPTSPDALDAFVRFTIALVAAFGAAVIWRRFRNSSFRLARFVRRSLSDSAWDLILDRAIHEKSRVTVTVKRIDDRGNDGEACYFGSLAEFGCERASSEPIVSLAWVSRWDPETKKYVRLSKLPNDRLVFHRDQILRLGVLGRQAAPAEEKEKAL